MRLEVHLRFLAVLTCLAFPANLAAQPFSQPRRVELSESIDLNLADSAARNRLGQVRSYLGDAQWSEAVETLRQVQEEYGPRLLPLPEADEAGKPVERRYVSVRDYCHWQISALPPPALELYRQRVDAVAERWFQDALAAGDAAPLRRVLGEAFSSSMGDDALLRLGELALESGRYEQARQCWSRLLPLPHFHAVLQTDFERARTGAGEEAISRLLDENYQLNTSSEPHTYFLRRDRPLAVADARALARFWKSRGQLTELTYPDSDVPPAQVDALLTLVSILEGDLSRAARELERFRRWHGAAEGKITGRTLPLAEFLDMQLRAAASWPSRQQGDSWPMFAGNPQRNGQGRQAVDIRGAAWRVPLTKVVLADREVASMLFRPRRPAEDSDALLSYFPVVERGRVFYRTEYQVFARNLSDGQPCWPTAQGRPPGEIFYVEPTPNLRYHSPLGVPRFTLTVHGNKLLARMGASPTTSNAQTPSGRKSDSFVICLDLAAQGRSLWEYRPESDDWAVEGAPLADGRQAYVVLRQGGVRSRSYVAALDLETGRLVWRQFICGADTPGGSDHSEITHNLLTLHEETLYYNSNLGAVAALSTDGEWKWLTRYPRARYREEKDLIRKPAHYYRDVNPAVYHGGMLYVAPSDSDRILALDAASGEILWQTVHAEDAVHLLGVAHDTLVASGDRLWWFDARFGNARADAWPRGPRPLGIGRGLISGASVYFPTQDKIYAFDLTTLAPLRQPIDLKVWTAPVESPVAAGPGDRNARGGHLIVAEGYLLIAGADELLAFKLDEGTVGEK